MRGKKNSNRFYFILFSKNKMYKFYNLTVMDQKRRHTKFLHVNILTSQQIN